MFKKITLENGMRILTAPMEGTNTVTMLVMCGTGSDYEANGQRGISHFLEHMFFKGTTSRPTHRDISQELDQMGSISNAFTSHETTGYYIKAGALYTDRIMEILADIYKNSLLSREEIEREKQVVIEEMHLDHDTPTTYIWHMWEQALWGEQPAGLPISGDEATIRQLQRDDFLTYFTHHYVAGNTAVVIAGNFDEAKVVAKLTELFGGIREAAPRAKAAFQATPSAPHFSFENRAIDQSHLLIGFHGYDAFDEQRYAADVLATLLGGSWSSRMFMRIREELGLAYSVFSVSENYSNRGFLASYAGVAHPNVEAATRAVLEEYRRIREEPVKHEELLRIKEFLKGRTLMALETSDAVSHHIGGEEMLTGKPMTVEEIFAKVDALTPAHIQAVASSVIRRERLSAILLGPTPDPKIESLINSFR